MTFKLLFATSAIGLFALVYGCSSSDDKGSSSSSSSGENGEPTSPYPSCQAILHACHPLDVGDVGDIHDCHELAHDEGTEAKCAEQKDKCLKACVPDAGAASGGDAG